MRYRGGRESSGEHVYYPKGGKAWVDSAQTLNPKPTVIGFTV